MVGLLVLGQRDWQRCRGGGGEVEGVPRAHLWSCQPVVGEFFSDEKKGLLSLPTTLPTCCRVFAVPRVNGGPPGALQACCLWPSWLLGLP